MPLVSEKDGDQKIIKWFPIFIDCLAQTYGVRGLRDDPTVPLKADDPLDAHSCFGISGGLQMSKLLVSVILVPYSRMTTLQSS